MTRTLPILSLLLSLIACRETDKSAETDTDRRPDLDADGHIADTAGGDDCDDADSEVHPGATELCGDGVDNDCDASTPEVVCSAHDLDGDGHAAVADGGDDCDDDDPSVSPDATEGCNGLDDDCDGLIDEGDAFDALTWYRDRDEDGFGDPSAPEQACDQPDGAVADDTDCDDTRADVNPMASEVCDAANTDEDCDGVADDDDDDVAPATALEYFADADSDSYVDADRSSVTHCDPYVDESGVWWLSYDAATSEADCDDDAPEINPSALEICDDDDVDEDCDGVADDADTSADPGTMSPRYDDSDNDDYGDPDLSRVACDAPAGYVDNALDCAPDDPGLPLVWTIDDDEDGFGDKSPGAATQVACVQPDDYVANTDDCDDSDGDLGPYYVDGDLDEHGGDIISGDCTPYAGNVANSDDCDDSIPTVTLSETYYLDTDGDGYGAESSGTGTYCPNSVGKGYVDCDSDCDDDDAGIHPGAQEVCDKRHAIDEDCDGYVDDEDASVQAASQSDWYKDKDTDGFGNAASTTRACSRPSGYVDDATDCNDSKDTINPDMPEICDARDVDEDCNGVVNDDDSSVTGTTAYYPDSDGDNYGRGGSEPEWACDAPSNYTDDDSDCDDNDDDISPGETEVCNGLDDDCDDEIDSDEACSTAGCTWRWRSSNEHAYLFCTDPDTSTEEFWDMADATCLGMGYHLVTINDAVEDLYIEAKMEDDGTTRAYIGLKQVDGKDRWISQENMTGTPDCSADAAALYSDSNELIYKHLESDDGGQSCGTAYFNKSGYFYWEDSECGHDDDRYFICESCDLSYR